MRFDRAGNQGGFTLIELMIVVGIIGIIAAIVTPKVVGFLERTKIARAASDLKVMVKGFHLYAIDNQDQPNSGYPDDTHQVLPTGVEYYVDNNVFVSDTPLGGRYNWDGPDNYSYAGLAFENPTVAESVMVQLDAKIDDGDLNTGEFQKTPNSRYTFILWTP